MRQKLQVFGRRVFDGALVSVTGLFIAAVFLAPGVAAALGKIITGLLRAAIFLLTGW